MTCHNIEDCVRPQPEFIGYGPTPSAMLQIVLLLSIVFSCGCALSLLCSLCRRCRSRRYQNGRIYKEEKKSQLHSFVKLEAIERGNDLLEQEKYLLQQDRISVSLKDSGDLLSEEEGSEQAFRTPSYDALSTKNDPQSDYTK